MIGVLSAEQGRRQLLDMVEELTYLDFRVLCPFDSVPVPSLLWPHFPLVGPWEDWSPLTNGLY